MENFAIGLLLWNLLTFAVTGYDKAIAGRGVSRVPEKYLLGMAALMGALGVYAAMQLFRHKTRHAKFKYGIPVLLAVNILLAFWLGTYVLKG